MRFGNAAVVNQKGGKAGASSSGEGAKKMKHSLPWNEKFRPKNLDEIAYQKEVVAALRRSLETANLPHLLFYGPPGTGKTSTILAVARELYGPTIMKTRVMELNASDERGIDVVRHKVKNFAKVAVGTANLDPDYPCPPFKILVLDEADSMTRDAQSALRRTMERWSKVTRFCLICNYVSRIIAPVTSRCAKFRFHRLPSEHISKKLQSICDSEGLSATPATLKQLEVVSNGDLRKAITFLQSASLMAGEGEAITPENVKEVTVSVPEKFADEVFTASLAGFQDVHRAAEYTVQEGYPASMMLECLQKRVFTSDKLDEEAKAEVCIELAKADCALEEGANEHLQLLNVLAVISKAAARTRLI